MQDDENSFLYNVFAIIREVKHRENPCEVSAAAKENLCEGKRNKQASYLN